MKSERIVECTKCRKPFGLSGGRTGPMIDREEIICPHCGAVCGSDRIADVFRSRKLTSDGKPSTLAPRNAEVQDVGGRAGS